MKRAKVMASLGVIGCLMVAGAGGAAADDDENGNAVLAVRVVFEGGGLSGAVVKLSPGGGVESTDARGYAVFKRLAGGRYTISVDAKCHVTTAAVKVDDKKTNTATVRIDNRCPSGDPDVSE